MKNMNFKALIITLLIVTFVATGAVALYGIIRLKGRKLVLPLTPTTQTQQTTDQNSTLLGIFTGKFPCADCPGIEMKLRLFHNPTTLGATTYQLEQIYLEKNVEPFRTTGNWDVLRGTKTDPNATVYQLDPDKPGESTYYLKVNANTLLMLDNDLHKIDTPPGMSLTLTKIQE